MAKRKSATPIETVKQRVIREVLNHQCQFTRRSGPFDNYDYQPDELPPCSVFVPANLRYALAHELMEIEDDLNGYQAPLPSTNRLKTMYLAADPKLVELQEKYATLIAHRISMGYDPKPQSAPRKSHLRLVHSRD